MTVRRMKRVDISSPRLIGIDQIGLPPAKALFPKADQEQIRGYARMTAIAIGEWMNLHQPMRKSRCDFIRLIGLVLHPIPAILKKLPQGPY